MKETKYVHVKQKSGKTYVYENYPYWDKEKQQPRSKRILVGYLDDKTGKILPNKKYRTKKEVAIEITKKYNKLNYKKYGAVYLLDQISKKLGLVNCLKEVFPNIYKDILALTYYQSITGSNVMSDFEKFQTTHHIPTNNKLYSQRISDLFKLINDSQIFEFQSLFYKRNSTNELLAYDTTSISTYSTNNEIARYGHNKENDILPQMNMIMLCGFDTKLPYYYRLLPGNILDVSTVKNVIKEISMMEKDTKVKLVMDRGFYSKSNIDDLILDNSDFIMACRGNIKALNEEIRKTLSDIKQFKNLLIKQKVYSKKIKINWDIDENKLNKLGISSDTTQLYLYIYYDSNKYISYLDTLEEKILRLGYELENNNIVDSHKKMYDKYFIKKNNKYIVNEKVYEEEIAKCGIFTLISNINLKREEQLTIYRNKDIIEKHFHNLKDWGDNRRLKVSTEYSVRAKLFIGFLSLILTSQIRNLMKDIEIENMKFKDLINELDIIKLSKSGNIKLVTELTKQQKIIFQSLNIEIPE